MQAAQLGCPVGFTHACALCPRWPLALQCPLPGLSPGRPQLRLACSAAQHTQFAQDLLPNCALGVAFDICYLAGLMSAVPGKSCRLHSMPGP